MSTITAKADDLGDRMKELEMAEAGRKALPGIPLIVRLDGRAFHTLTRKMRRPYDVAFMEAMKQTTQFLVAEFRPIVGYTQSDEITLVFRNPENLFSGRFQKLTSVLAGFASAVFARHHLVNSTVDKENCPGWPTDTVECFDARAWQVPDLETALDVLIWREDDATKNSVAMLAQAHYSHKELHGKGRADQLDMLKAKGINWNKEPTHFKRGVYVKHRTVRRMLTADEWTRIPEKFRPPQDSVVERGEVYVLDIDPIRRFQRPDAILRLFTKETL